MESSVGASVRKAKTGDLEGLLAVLAQLNSADSPVQFPSAGIQETWGKIQAQQNRALLVAEIAGRIVGTVDWYLTPNLTHGGKPYITIENFVVDSAHRKRGIGTALLHRVIEEAKRAGCYKVQLQSDVRRGEAHRVYERAGFKPSSQGYRLYFEK
jgi:GNAT superfamily N-acetyltransferase